MSAPRCLLIGAGRLAGGFIAPLLRAAGWEIDLVCRDRAVCESIRRHGGVWLRTGAAPERRWIAGLGAVALEDAALPGLVAGADLLATAVGPSALPAIGRMLGPLLQERLSVSGRPCNVITFENHRSAPLLLASGLMAACPALAGAIGTRFGIGGAAVWRTVSQRTVADDGVCFEADAVDECYADAASLVPDAAPLDGSVPGIGLVRSFDDRMVEKLWVFNAGHAAAAYLGWQAGYPTVAAAMASPRLRPTVGAVVREAQQALDIHLSSRPGAPALPSRPLEAILDRYADRTLSDPVVRVAREPRRKLAANDRLIGPGVACLGAGLAPRALVGVAAAALAYGEPTDPQAADLQRELQLLGPEEVLAVVSTLDPRDELTRLIGARYRADRAVGVAD